MGVMVLIILAVLYTLATIAVVANWPIEFVGKPWHKGLLVLILASVALFMWVDVFV